MVKIAHKQFLSPQFLKNILKHVLITRAIDELNKEILTLVGLIVLFYQKKKSAFALQIT